MNYHLLFTLIPIVLIAGVIYMAFAMSRFRFLGPIMPRKKWKRGLVGLLLVIILMVVLCYLWDVFNMIIIMLHLLLAWIVCDFAVWLIKRTARWKPKYYVAGACAMLFTCVWLAVGWYNAHHVVATNYSITTEKPLGVPSLRVVGLSDSHIGAIFDGEGLGKYVAEINAQNPDAVVIMGDFIDDATLRIDMQNACKALGKLHPKYGVYYVYGNHDDSYFGGKRGYDLHDLDANLTANGVKILRDETVLLAGSTYICGRLDASRNASERKSAYELMQGVPENAYVITLDHEPNDYDAEADSGMDLILSGHTHGGQFLGLGPFGCHIGANDAYYGHERRGKTDFIVSSGIANWALQFKTGCIAEYIVVDINSKEK